MIKSILCDKSDPYLLINGSMSASNTAAAYDDINNNKIKEITKNCVPLEKCITEINDSQINNAQNIDVVMPMFKLLEYSEIYSKTLGSLFQYCRDESALGNTGAIVDFTNNNTTDLFR